MFIHFVRYAVRLPIALTPFSLPVIRTHTELVSISGYQDYLSGAAFLAGCDPFCLIGFHHFSSISDDFSFKLIRPLFTLIMSVRMCVCCVCALVCFFSLLLWAHSDFFLGGTGVKHMVENQVLFFIFKLCFYTIPSNYVSNECLFVTLVAIHHPHTRSQTHVHMPFSF